MGQHSCFFFCQILLLLIPSTPQSKHTGSYWSFVKLILLRITYWEKTYVGAKRGDINHSRLSYRWAELSRCWQERELEHSNSSSHRTGDRRERDEATEHQEPVPLQTSCTTAQSPNSSCLCLLSSRAQRAGSSEKYQHHCHSVPPPTHQQPSTND